MHYNKKNSNKKPELQKKYLHWFAIPNPSLRLLSFIYEYIYPKPRVKYLLYGSISTPNLGLSTYYYMGVHLLLTQD